MIDKIKSVLKEKYIEVDPKDGSIEVNNQFSIIDMGKVRVQKTKSEDSFANYFILMTHPDIFVEVQKILSKEFKNLEISPEEENQTCIPAVADCFYK